MLADMGRREAEVEWEWIWWSQRATCSRTRNLAARHRTV